jgi:hypothetical protein
MTIIAKEQFKWVQFLPCDGTTRITNGVRVTFDSAAQNVNLLNLWVQVDYADVEDANGVDRPNNVALPVWTTDWVKIYAKWDYMLKSVQFSAGTTAVNCYIYDATPTTQLASATINSWVATFNYQLTSWTSYYILFDWWDSEKRVDTNVFVWAGYPINKTNINYTYGYWDNSTHPNMLPWIDSITTSELQTDYPYTIEATWYNDVTWTVITKAGSAWERKTMLPIGTPTTDSHWVDFETVWTISWWERYGIKIHTNTACVLTDVTMHSDTTATKAYLYDWAGTTLLQTVDITTLVATFEYSLTNNTDYLILMDKWWAEYDISLFIGGYPYNETNINYVTWWDGSSWVTDDTWVYWVVSVETLVAADFHVTVDWTDVSTYWTVWDRTQWTTSNHTISLTDSAMKSFTTFKVYEQINSGTLTVLADWVTSFTAPGTWTFVLWNTYAYQVRLIYKWGTSKRWYFDINVTA